MSRHGGTIHEIVVEGKLDATWLEWFESMTIRHDTGDNGVPISVLRGPIADQTQLRGMLESLWDMNLVVLSVVRSAQQVKCEDHTEEDLNV